MSDNSERKPRSKVMFSWWCGIGCKAAADLLAVLTLYFHFNYFIAAPLILFAGIILTAWASSSWMYAILVSGVFLVNVFLCGCIAQVYGFWSNPWIVVSAWLWGLAALACLVSRFVRWFCSVLSRKDKDTKSLSNDVYRAETWFKRTIPVLAILILAGLVLGVSFFIRSESRLEDQYTECDAKEMVARLERIFQINFPEEIKEAKAAKTPGSSWDRWNKFILKFAAEPDAVDRFLESFPEKIHFKPYEYRKDMRGELGMPPIPPWFREPIQQGKCNLEGQRRPRRSLLDWIYIDTSNEKQFVVYLEGRYSRKLEK